MSHTKPYIRKKAVLIMYKVFLKYPESLRPAFPRLKEKLEDPDPGVEVFISALLIYLQTTRSWGGACALHETNSQCPNVGFYFSKMLF